MTRYVVCDSTNCFDHQFTARSVMLAGVTALGLALGACGGGGGGAGIASTPAPPPTATPTPTPSPVALGPPTVDLLPGKKTTTREPVIAVVGGPTLRGAAEEDFNLPLIITAVTANFSGDTVTIEAGAVQYKSDGLSQVDLNNPALRTKSYHFNTGFTLADGRSFKPSVNENLDYTRFGSWWVGRNTTQGLAMEDNGVFVGGLETPTGNIPTTGTASYAGKVVGHYSDYHGCACASFSGVIGKVSLSANFSSKTLSGLMSSMQVIPDTALSGFMNNVSFAASFGSPHNLFTGTTAVASMPNSPFALGANASGSIVGAFYGPSAQEVGAVWTLSDGTRRVIGSFGAKQ